MEIKILKLILIFIGIDGTKGKVFGCCNLSLGQDIEEGGFAHVGEPDNATFQVGT